MFTEGKCAFAVPFASGICKRLEFSSGISASRVREGAGGSRLAGRLSAAKGGNRRDRSGADGVCVRYGVVGMDQARWWRRVGVTRACPLAGGQECPPSLF